MVGAAYKRTGLSYHGGWVGPSLYTNRTENMFLWELVVNDLERAFSFLERRGRTRVLDSFTTGWKEPKILPFASFLDIFFDLPSERSREGS